MISCRQIALADLILVNKVDLVSHAEIKALKDKIRSQICMQIVLPCTISYTTPIESALHEHD